MRRTLMALCLGLLIGIGQPLRAGSQSGGGELSLEQAAQVGKRLERALAEHGARVAIVARVGRPRDQLPEGIHYTHVAYAVYATIRLADGSQVPGYSFYNLYQQAEQPDHSVLVTDFATDFYLGAVIEDTAVLIPRPEVQRKLLKVINSPGYAALHNPKYSVIANPYDLSRQNCTEMVLDVLQAALYDSVDRARLKTNLRAYFQAQPVMVSPLELMIGSLTSADVTLADHQDGSIRTATFGSLGRYMNSFGLLSDGFEIGPDGAVSRLVF